MEKREIRLIYLTGEQQQQQVILEGLCKFFGSKNAVSVSDFLVMEKMKTLWFQIHNLHILYGSFSGTVKLILPWLR